MAWWLFQNAVITSALALLVVIVCRVTRIGPVARHALWVLVLVKFVTPPPFNVPLPTTLAPSMKVTVPTGVPAPGLDEVTVAVKVTDWPNVLGFVELVSVVVVLAWLTVCVTLPVLCANSESPL